jgi:hypothetical protein
LAWRPSQARPPEMASWHFFFWFSAKSGQVDAMQMHRIVSIQPRPCRRPPSPFDVRVFYRRRRPLDGTPGARMGRCRMEYAAAYRGRQRAICGGMSRSLLLSHAGRRLRQGGSPPPLPNHTTPPLTRGRAPSIAVVYRPGDRPNLALQLCEQPGGPPSPVLYLDAGLVATGASVRTSWQVLRACRVWTVDTGQRAGSRDT